jgi:HTH-type transcriptional regulator / antitoxin HigA
MASKTGKKMMIRKELKTQSGYVTVMTTIEKTLQKVTQKGGFSGLSPEEADELQRLSLLAETYENSIPVFSINPPQSLAQMIRLKMMQMNMKQKEMSKILGITESHLSEILTKKRRVNIDIAKKLRSVLKIEADFILDMA